MLASTMKASAHDIVGSMTVALLLRAVHCVDHVVTFSDAPIWTVGFGVAYPDMSITVGETLNFASHSDHDVILLHAPTVGTHWEQCGMQGIAGNTFTTIWGASDFSEYSATERHYTPQTCGVFYITCSVPPHCAYGQRVKVNVQNADGSACSSPCVDAACVTAASKASVAIGPLRDVKPTPNSQYWGSSALYDPITVNIGDTVMFQTGAGYHDVATVPSAVDLSACDVSAKTVLAEWEASGLVSAACNASNACCPASSCGLSGMSVTYKFSAKAAGVTYFVCSVGSHCKTGQKFALTVNDPNAPQATSTVTVTPGKGSANSAEAQGSLPVVELIFALVIPALLCK